MRVISSSELRSNMKKYLDMARTEQIVIQRGKNETYILTRQEQISPDNDINRALTAEELLTGIESDIKDYFKKSNLI